MTPIHDSTSPEAAVRAWWEAWERKDRAALERLTREDYVEFTGDSEKHRVGREALLAVAEKAFATFAPAAWRITDVQQLRPTDDVALVGYRWRIDERRGDGRVRHEGAASDVLVWSGEGWRYLSHHRTTTDRAFG